MTTNRENMLRKIAALRAKTADNGATEAEAMAAAEKAAELMIEHEIDEAELAESGEREEMTFGRKFTNGANGKVAHKVNYCGRAIGNFTSTRCVEVKRNGIIHMSFVGERTDVELAVFLHETIKWALDAEYARWSSGRRTGRGAKASFQMGMVNRVCERLRELTATRDEHRGEECRALVVHKSALVDDTFRKFYPNVRRGGGSQVSNANAYGAGKVAGDRVGFGRPVGSSGGAAAIGHSN